MRESRENGLTVKQYLLIGGVSAVIFATCVWLTLTLGDYFANWIGPVY